MSTLDRLLTFVPNHWIRAVGRAQWRHPALRHAVEWAAGRFRGRDATIARGAGRGLRFNAGNANAGFVLGTSEPAVQAALAALARPGMTVFDVGANVGFLSVIAARGVGAAGRVVAFEPVLANAERIRHNAGLNGFTQLAVRAEALGATDGEARFLTSAQPTWGKLASVAGAPARAAGEITVAVRRLDGLVGAGEVPLPDLIKVDVEGAEADVLDGAEECIRAARPILLIELHGTNAAIDDRLRRLDYQAWVLGGTAQIVDSPWDAYVIAAPREDAERMRAAAAAHAAAEERR